MNRYLIATIAALGIAFTAGSAFACQKNNSAQTERIPDSQQSSSSSTTQQPG